MLLDREKSTSRRLGRSSFVINIEFGCVCMESVRSAQGGPDFHYTSVECRSSSHDKKTKTKEIGKTTRGSNEGGSEEIKACEDHQRGVFPQVVI